MKWAFATQAIGMMTRSTPTLVPPSARRLALDFPDAAFGREAYSERKACGLRRGKNRPRVHSPAKGSMPIMPSRPPRMRNNRTQLPSRARTGADAARPRPQPDPAISRHGRRRGRPVFSRSFRSSSGKGILTGQATGARPAERRRVGQIERVLKAHVTRRSTEPIGPG